MIRTVIGTVAMLAMTGSAVANQRPRLPPKPCPTAAFQTRVNIPDILPEQIDMAPECERLEQVFGPENPEEVAVVE